MKYWEVDFGQNPLCLISCLNYFLSQALQKKQLIASGKLDKHGKPNETTPKEWLEEHPDLRFEWFSFMESLTIFRIPGWIFSNRLFLQSTENPAFSER